MSVFDDLYTSLQEVFEIKQCKAQAGSIKRHEVADGLTRKHLVDTWHKNTARKEENADK